METDLDEMGRHFERYPNFEVAAAGISYFILQPHDKVRAFLIKYQDRILYGTDLGLHQGGDAAKTLRSGRTIPD